MLHRKTSGENEAWSWRLAHNLPPGLPADTALILLQPLLVHPFVLPWPSIAARALRHRHHCQQAARRLHKAPEKKATEQSRPFLQ